MNQPLEIVLNFLLFYKNTIFFKLQKLEGVLIFKYVF